MHQKTKTPSNAPYPTEATARDHALSPRELSDLELLNNGAFAPLTGFQTQNDYESVLEGMPLQTGALWPIPITLDVPETFAKSIDAGETIGLRDAEGVVPATMQAQDIWLPDHRAEAQAVYGTGETPQPFLRRSLPPASRSCSGWAFHDSDRLSVDSGADGFSCASGSWAGTFRCWSGQCSGR